MSIDIDIEMLFPEGLITEAGGMIPIMSKLN
jgi:hypothetical protein